jgi:hypothetical protein
MKDRRYVISLANCKKTQPHLAKETKQWIDRGNIWLTGIAEGSENKHLIGVGRSSIDMLFK